MTVTKNKSKYWGIQEGSEGIGFTGTFTQCWNELVKNFGSATLAELDQQNIMIVRIK